MPLDAAAYRKKVAEYAKSKQPATEDDPAENQKREKRTKAKDDRSRKRSAPTDVTVAAEGNTSKSAKQFKVGGQGGYPAGDSIFVPDWGLKINESVTTDAESAVKFMRGVVPPEDRETIRKYDPSHLTGLLAIASSTALFLSNEVTEQLLKLVEMDEIKEKKIRQLEESEAAAKADVDNARATLQRIDAENVHYQKQNKKLRERFAKKEEEWKKAEKEHLDGNLIMYSTAWMELRAKAKEKYPEMDLSGIPSDYPLDETINDPPAARESDETLLEATENEGRSKLHDEGDQSGEGDGGEEAQDDDA